MTYDILATGSTGNCVILNGEIAIDMCIPMKKLRESGYIKDLRLVLLTHEHGDHFNKATVQALHKERPALRWVCCKWMVFPLLEAGVDKRAIILVKPGRWYQCGFCIQFKAETLVHDVENCGYHLKLDYETAFCATDTGTLDHIEAKGYDPEALRERPRLSKK